MELVAQVGAHLLDQLARHPGWEHVVLVNAGNDYVGYFKHLTQRLYYVHESVPNPGSYSDVVYRITDEAELTRWLAAHTPAGRPAP